MTKNHRSRQHYRIVINGNNKYSSPDRPQFHRPSDSYAQSRIVNASRTGMRQREGGLRLLNKLNPNLILIR